VTAFPAWPDGERLHAAVAPLEVARDHDPSLGLPEALAGFQRAAAGRRDLRLRAGDLRFRDGTLLAAGERLRLRPHAVRQLHHLVHGSGVRVRRGDDLRRGLALLGGRGLVLRVEDDQVRAIVGERFAPIDDTDILARITRAAEAMRWRDLRVRFIATSERATIVRATLGRSRVDLRAGDAWERGLELRNSEVGASAFSVVPLVFRAACWNYSIASRPTLRLVHLGSAHRLVRDHRKDLAFALDRARPLLSAWSTSPIYDDANAITSAARDRSLRERVRMERRAQALVEDAALARSAYAMGTP
jgi:hypothetical protein